MSTSIHQEGQRQETLDILAQLRQAEQNCGTDIPTVAHRRNGESWQVTLPLDDLLALLARGEA